MGEAFLPFIEITSIYDWLNSLIVLYWVHGSGRRPEVFVRRRVDEARKFACVDCWHKVEFKFNSVDYFIQSLWFSEILHDNLRFQVLSPRLLGYATYNKYSLKNLQLKEDITLLRLYKLKEKYYVLTKLIYDFEYWKIQQFQ